MCLPNRFEIPSTCMYKKIQYTCTNIFIRCIYTHMHFDSANEIWFFYETSAAYVIYTFSKQFDIAGEMLKCNLTFLKQKKNVKSQIGFKLLTIWTALFNIRMKGKETNTNFKLIFVFISMEST